MSGRAVSAKWGETTMSLVISITIRETARLWQIRVRFTLVP
jgi:hypothetical protein